ncbi:MAG: hypothetical protein EBT00_00410 [Proteobacteria bacterium]|nr:hypothetical protein [Pseudomonadota bacterium]NBT95864.1 hypothetical protein [Chloroflexota bacterium]HAN14328.1 hypothetical protein [Chloroflexota bacterium]
MNWVVGVGSDVVAIPVLRLPQFLMFISAGPGWFRHPDILFARDGAQLSHAVIKPAAAGQPFH